MVQEIATVLQQTTLSLWNSFVLLVPNLFYAFIVLIVGYILGKAVGKLIEVFLGNFFNIDKWLKRKNLQDAFFGFSMTSLVGGAVKWYIYLVFIIQAFSLLNIKAFSMFLEWLTAFTPKIFAAFFIFVFGALVSEWVKQQTLKAKIPYKSTAGSFVKGLGLYIFLIAALQNIGIDVTIFITAFQIFLFGLVLTFALSFGISFGLALKDDAKKWLRKMRK